MTQKQKKIFARTLAIVLTVLMGSGAIITIIALMLQ